MYCNYFTRKFLYFCHVIYFFVRWMMRNFQRGQSDSLACLSGKTAIVTGGSKGIGYATTVLLASRGCKVIIACRSDATTAREEIIKITSNTNVTTATLDLASLKSVRNFAEDIKRNHEKIDILVNNAGIGFLRQNVTPDGLNATMQTNFFGAFLLTHLLLEPLKASGRARVIFTTSGLAIFNRLTVNNLNMTDYEINLFVTADLYNNSKLCNILAAREFARRLHDHHILFNTADTGVARTEIFKKTIEESQHWSTKLFSIIRTPLNRDKFNAAQTTFHLASSEKLNDEDNGKVYFRCKPFIHPINLHDQEFCEEIWKQTEQLVGLSPEEKI